MLQIIRLELAFFIAVNIKAEDPLDLHDDNGEMGDTGTLCRFCGKTMASRTHLRTHIEDMHFPTETPCPVCDKMFLSKPKMLRHKSKLHSEVLLVGHEETPGGRRQGKSTSKRSVEPEVIIDEKDIIDEKITLDEKHTPDEKVAPDEKVTPKKKGKRKKRY